MTLETKPTVYYAIRVFTQFEMDQAIEAEREACALICDEHADDPVYCGAAIRARGNT